eukprot:m.136438 g.136438  ORF g.136438 m.136438 type:complete len:91 (+) comp14733_c0_seq3:3215-3487(+)
MLQFENISKRKTEYISGRIPFQDHLFNRTERQYTISDISCVSGSGTTLEEHKTAILLAFREKVLQWVIDSEHQLCAWVIIYKLITEKCIA